MKDINGREWEMHVTIGSIRKFQQRTGSQIFKLLYDTWMEHCSEACAKTGDEDVDNTATMAAIAVDLFPGIDEAAAFVYECAIPVDGKAKPSYDEFCDSVSPFSIAVVGMDLVRQLQEFMPDKDKTLKKVKGESAPLPR